MEKCSFQAVLFDLDGTLTNTLDDIADAMNRTLRRHGLPEWETDAYRYMVGNGPVLLSERAAGSRQDLVPSVLKMYNEDYHAHNAVKTAPYPGIPELLEQLAARRLKLCVYSNKPDADAREVVSHYFPGIAFDLVRGSAPGQPMKPDPAVPLAMARQLGIDPAAFAYLGDTDVDILCAGNAGMRSFGVLWGFRDAAELTKAGAAALLKHPLELLDYIG